MTYTVYLHIGTAKNWILQYSLPRSKEATSPAIFVGRPEAPWPYDMTRPSIDADVNADAIMVHGFVNALGRFEQLAINFPTQLAEDKVSDSCSPAVAVQACSAKRSTYFGGSVVDHSDGGRMIPRGYIALESKSESYCEMTMADVLLITNV